MCKRALYVIFEACAGHSSIKYQINTSLSESVFLKKCKEFTILKAFYSDKILANVVSVYQ